MTMSASGTNGRSEPAEAAVVDALLARILLAADLPAAAAEALRRAAACYADGERAERDLMEAHRLAPDHFAPLISLYRFYFYKNRLGDALHLACACLAKAARENGIAPDWRRVQAEDAPFGSYDAVLPRLYMFCLKAYAYLQLRTGDRDEAFDAVHKLLELDPADKINAGLLLDVLRRAEACDD